MRAKWNINRTGATWTLSRGGRTRFDVSAEVGLPAVLRPARLAHLVRQDLWRTCQQVRGFSPIVEVCLDRETRIRAGGQIDGAYPTCLPQTIDAMLTCKSRQTRWLRDANKQKKCLKSMVKAC